MLDGTSGKDKAKSKAKLEKKKQLPDPADGGDAGTGVHMRKFQELVSGKVREEEGECRGWWWRMTSKKAKCWR